LLFLRKKMDQLKYQVKESTVCLTEGCAEREYLSLAHSTAVFGEIAAVAWHDGKKVYVGLPLDLWSFYPVPSDDGLGQMTIVDFSVRDSYTLSVVLAIGRTFYFPAYERALSKDLGVNDELPTTDIYSLLALHFGEGFHLAVSREDTPQEEGDSLDGVSYPMVNLNVE